MDPLHLPTHLRLCPACLLAIYAKLVVINAQLFIFYYCRACGTASL